MSNPFQFFSVVVMIDYVCGMIPCLVLRDHRVNIMFVSFAGTWSCGNAFVRRRVPVLNPASNRLCWEHFCLTFLDCLEKGGHNVPATVLPNGFEKVNQIFGFFCDRGIPSFLKPRAAGLIGGVKPTFWQVCPKGGYWCGSILCCV